MSSAAATTRWLVALAGLPELLTYHSQDANIQVGSRVIVPVRNKFRTGIVWAEQTETVSYKTKSITRLLEESPYYGREQMQWLNTVAMYYGITPSRVLQQGLNSAMLPDVIDGWLGIDPTHIVADDLKSTILLEAGPWRKKKPSTTEGWLRYPRYESAAEFDDLQAFVATPEGRKQKTSGKRKAAMDLWSRPIGASALELQAIYANPRSQIRSARKVGWIVPVETDHTPPPPIARSNLVSLTTEQQSAIQAISTSTQPVLLHGPTGSGKSEVLYQLAHHYAQMGKTVLYLCPEIGLATQVARRMSDYVPATEIYHSGLTDLQRGKVIRRVQQGLVSVLVGARSAMFVPTSNLGLIIVDEEHENGYKSPEAPYWHGRNLALQRANQVCPIVVASATPSADTWHNVQRGKFAHIAIPAFRALPRTIHTVSPSYDSQQPIPEDVLAEMSATIERGDQVALLHNRRGRFRHTYCRSCKSPVTCPHCDDVPLVTHGTESNPWLLCHLCGYRTEPPKHCQHDESHTRFIRKSPGTVRWEEWAQETYPDQNIMRIDGDISRSASAWLDRYDALQSGNYNVIIGTQMLAKGFDLPALSTLVIVGIDAMLEAPDPRAWERAFTLVTQAIGRIGRRGQGANAYILTDQPHHTVFKHALRGDMQGFMAAELERRQRAGFPPFSRAALVRVRSPNPIATDRLREYLLVVTGRTSEIELLGPLEQTTRRIAAHHVAVASLCSPSAKKLHTALIAIKANWEASEFRSHKLLIDIDPVDWGA